jgi:hypothetical protein
MCRSVALALVIAAGTAAPSFGQAVEVIYTKKAGHPKAAVPGAVDLSGNPEATEWRAMEDLAVSSDGSRWVLKARTQQASDHDVGVVYGTGTSGAMLSLSTGAASFVVQEGRPAPFGNNADWFDFVSSGFAKFDDNNKMVLGMRCRTTQTGATAATDAMRVIRWDGTTANLAFKQGDLYVDMVDIPANPSGDETVGNSVNSFHLLNDGRVGASDLTIGNISSTRRPAISYDREMFHQINVTTVPGYGGGPQVTWSAMDTNSFYSTPDASHWVMSGRHTSSTGATIFVYDGAVLLEEAQAIPGTSIMMGDVLQASLAPSGDYIVRGRDNSGTTAAAPDWAVLNGALVAKSGDPIVPGSAELWGDTFFAVTVNSHGDYVIVGNSGGGDPSRDDVIVFNGTTVVAREGQPVDLDGNGQFDDDAFIGRGVNTNAAFGVNVTNGATSWWLSEDRVLHGILMLRDSAGNDLNSNPSFGTPQAFVRINLGGPAPCYANCDGSTVAPVLNVQDFTCFLQRYAAGESYANCDQSTVQPVLNVQDFTCFLQRYAAGCP